MVGGAPAASRGAPVRGAAAVEVLEAVEPPRIGEGMQMKLSQSDLQKIEEAVQRVERTTRGEIVPVLLSQSASYSDAGHLLALDGAIAAGVSSYCMHEVLGPGWTLSTAEFALEIAAGWGIGMALSFIPAVRRMYLGRRRLAETVQERAFAAFTRNGLMNTTDRCGVLLLVSLFERRAVLLGDRGIHAVVGDDYWKEELGRITDGIHGQNIATALLEGVTRIGALMADKFPPDGTPRDELSNRLKTDLHR